MIRRVTAYKSRYGVRYSVLYGRHEKRYTNENLPKTVKTFMQTHPYRKLEGTKMIFEGERR